MVTSHAELLGSNEEPDDTQLQDIRALVSGFQRDLMGYGSAKASTLITFSSALQSLQYYTQYQIPLSPIRRLPNEILICIFRHCLSLEKHELGVGLTPLTQVCRHWRILVRPILASCGTFAVHRGVLKSSNRSNDALASFRDFLGSLPSRHQSPFSLIISDSIEGNNFRNPLLDAILMQSRRFVYLKISINFSALNGVTGRLINGVNNLRSLTLDIPGKAGDYGGYLYVFDSAKQLQYVEVTTPMTMLLKLPVNRLLSYKECSLGGVNVPHVLQYGAVLKELAFTIHRPAFTPFELDVGSDVPKALQSLDLRTYNFDEATTGWMGSINSKVTDHDVDLNGSSVRCILPYLRSIRLRDPYRNVTVGLHRTITVSCAGPSSRLTRIALCGSRAYAGDLADLLHLTPNLRYLEYRHISRVDLVSMIPDGTSKVRAPKLETLVIHDAGVGIVSALQDLVAARRSPSFEGEMLRRVRLLYGGTKGKEAIERALGASPASENGELEASILRLLGIIKNLEAPKDGWSFFQRILPSSLRRGETQSIVGVLHDLEAVPLSDPGALELTHIHTLNNFSLIYRNTILPGSEDLSSRIEVLLRRWISAFQLHQLVYNHNAPKPRWISVNPHCISLAYASPYICTEDRQNIPSEYDILYGFYRPPMREEVFWVHEDCSGGRNI
ncbi:hypothetical protein BJ165DRAFT_1526476 [Panaeolus papilionaceus]|nr:hypothetical protein BJ165DRAFT_1526476 [Panaeolus papilionaceus]